MMTSFYVCVLAIRCGTHRDRTGAIANFDLPLIALLLLVLLQKGRKLAR